MLKFSERKMPIHDTPPSREDVSSAIDRGELTKALTAAFAIWEKKGRRTDYDTVSGLAFAMAMAAPPEIRPYHFGLEPFGFLFFFKDHPMPFRMIVTASDANGVTIAVERNEGSITEVRVDGSDDERAFPSYYGPAGHA